MLVAVPSKGRAGMVRTQTVLPTCSIFVPVLEAEAHRQAGARNLIAMPNDVLGITRTRNWILRNTRDRWVVMIDDDVRTHGWVELLPHAAMKQSLDTAQWLAEFRKIFAVTEGVGYRAWGVATDGATRAVYPFYPFRWRSYITASCMGIINDGRTYFDESYPVKEDYELCARLITEDGGVVSAQYLFWVNNHWHDEGGCKDYRTQTMEEDCIRRLRRTYPNLVRVAQRKDNQWAIEIAA
jgi:glycosyltransferase involved in cell wall biosynthesis